MTFRAIKDPDADLDYKVDWSTWLGADTIATSAWTITGPDALLVAGVKTNTTTTTTVWLSGGTLDAIYSLTNRITTAGGRTDDRTISVQILNR